jgi:hypothetical protein
MADAREVQERFRIALELFELGESMLRQRIRREKPDASDAYIERKIREWLSHRPGAEHGDAPGRPVPWPRRGR